MKPATLRAAAMIAALGAIQPAGAQDHLASAAQRVLSAVQPMHMSAEIVAIDAGNRALTLKGPHGDIAIVLVGQQAAGFDELKTGDRVDVLYRNAVLTRVEKRPGAGKGIRERADRQSVTPASGGYEATRQTEVLATVLKIDREERRVTLRGAAQTQIFEAAPDLDLHDLKVGDTVHAVFVSAAAVQVTRVGQ